MSDRESWLRNEINRTAIHEAGHAAMSVLRGWKLKTVYVATTLRVLRDQELGFTLQNSERKPEEERIADWDVISASGVVAEELFGYINNAFAFLTNLAEQTSRIDKDHDLYPFMQDGILQSERLINAVNEARLFLEPRKEHIKVVSDLLLETQPNGRRSGRRNAFEATSRVCQCEAARYPRGSARALPKSPEIV